MKARFGSTIERRRSRRLISSIALLIIILAFSSKPTQVESQSPTLDCSEAQKYYGIQHCTDVNGEAHIIVVDLKDPHIRVQTVLSLGPNGECNSVNGIDRDGEPLPSNCPFPYPFEPVTSMLERYREQGAVAIINTDYFGCDPSGGPYPCGGSVGDHGAQGLAVRNGIRLDGPDHGVDNDLAYTTPSLAVSSLNTVTIGVPGSPDVINNNLSSIYTNTVGGSPLLVVNGQFIPNPCSSPSHRYGNRCSQPSQSAAGLTDDGRLVLITARKNATDTVAYLTTDFSINSALKFDGGGSARLAWLGSTEEITSFGGTSDNRPVAEGLLVFSTPIVSLLDRTVIPSDGTVVSSNIVLESGVQYSIVVSSTYRYDVGEPGEFADAQYREDDSDQWTIRWNSIEFDGTRLTADIFDLENHTYTFYVTGQGQSMTFRIYDEPGNYGDNEGSLTATIMSMPTYTISGQVADNSGKSIPGVTVSANAQHQGITDDGGIYSMTGFPARNYTLVPSKECFSFSPPSLTVTVPPNAIGQDFVGTPSVCPIEAALNQGNCNTTIAAQLERAIVAEATDSSNEHAYSSGHIRSAADVEELIALYRQLRDEVLLSSGAGREYVEKYNENGPELSTILLTDADLRTRTAQFLDNAALAFGSLLPDATEDAVLTQALYDEADGLVQDLATAGSPEFRSKMLQTWANMDLDEHIGETTKEIWEQMQQHALYLPVILKND